MKHTFISLGFYCILFVCSGCTREIEINDEGETEQARIPLVVQTTTCDFNNVSANGKPSTWRTDLKPCSIPVMLSVFSP